MTVKTIRRAGAACGTVSALLTVMGAAAFSGRAGAAEWCVSPAGNDAATGTAQAPFRTVARALREAKPGDDVLLKAGVYEERIVPSRSGEPGKPIVIRGERGPGGAWLSIVDAAAPLRAVWSPAPEVGPGVYKAPIAGAEPHHMLVGHKVIPRIWPLFMADGTGFEKLAYPADREVTTTYLQGDVFYWDTVGAMFGCRDGAVYLRFRDGDDPNGLTLRAAPAGGGVRIENRRHIVVRDLLVRGGESCVEIRGAKAHGNTIERCRLVNGRERVTITSGAAHNTVRDNEITTDFYAGTCRTGAWSYPAKGEAVPYEFRLKEHFYNEYKHFFGPHSTSDYGVRIFRAGPGNVVVDNHVFAGGQGISVYDAGEVRIHGNRVHGFSSLGLICTLNRTVDVRLYDNLVYDCNINLRIHHVNEWNQPPRRSLHVYRNRFRQDDSVGTHIYFHYNPQKDGKWLDVTPYPHAAIFIYHNSFSGGAAGLSLSGWAEECEGLPNCAVLNNVISSAVAVRASMPFIGGERMFGLFDHNWLGGAFKTARAGHDYTKAPWYGPHNIFVRDGRLWQGEDEPDFRLPATSRARRRGRDLSRPIVVNGTDRGPLPGMAPGYFGGDAPDIGAVQTD